MKRTLTALFLNIAIAAGFSGAVQAQEIKEHRTQETSSVKDTLGTSVTLDRIVVKAQLDRKTRYGTSYRITDRIRGSAGSPIDLLNHIDGVIYNEIDNTIKVRTDTRILLTVDGLEKSRDYIMSLPPERIAKIEVIDMPEARYVAAGYRYVINYILKKEWTGHDVSVQNFNMISAGDNNGENIIANEQPKIRYMYTSEKVNMNVGYGFADIHWNYPVSYSKTYTGKADITSEIYTEKTPNDLNAHRAHSVNAGAEFRIAPTHVLAWNAVYTGFTDRRNSHFGWKETENDITKEFTELQKDISANNNFNTSLVYKAAAGEKWNFYSAIGYEYLKQDRENSYSLSNGYGNFNQYINTKNYIRGELDAAYDLNERIRLNAGYIMTWNEYGSGCREDAGRNSGINDMRHQLYAYVDYSPAQNLLLHIGSGAEYLHGLKRSMWHWLPQVSASYMPSENVQLILDYNVKTEYPKLYQTTGSDYETDRWSMFKSNPDLMPSRIHSLSLQSVFWGSLMLGVIYNRNERYITEIYGMQDGKTVKSFTNAENRYVTGFISYDWNITDDITWKNVAQISFEKMTHRDFSPAQFTNILFNSQLNYNIRPARMNASVSYQRNMVKEPLLQGWSEYGQDMWQISLRKGFWGNRINASLNYVPPVHFGVRTSQRNCINTDFYKYNGYQNLKTYDNLLLIRIQFRFSSGKKAKAIRNSFEFEDESRKGNGLL